jgi:hypothetical protein
MALQSFSSSLICDEPIVSIMFFVGHVKCPARVFNVTVTLKA